MNGSAATGDTMEKKVLFQSMIDLPRGLNVTGLTNMGRSVSTGDMHYLK